ncbi:Nn.00g041030.m01.CDS01 [Neocucurbitaria sp. VM-36]
MEQTDIDQPTSSMSLSNWSTWLIAAQESIAVQEFLVVGAHLDAETDGDEYDVDSYAFHHFNSMTKLLEFKGIDILEWIDGLVPDNLLDALFIKRLPTWCQTYHSIGIFWNHDNSNEPRQAISDMQGEMLTESNLPSNTPSNGLSFTPEELLSDMAAADAEFLNLTEPASRWDAFLLKLRELVYNKVNIPAFLDGHIPPGEGLMLNGLLSSVNTEGLIINYAQAVVHIGVSMLIDTYPELAEPTASPHVNREDAVAFVNALPTVDISTIPRADMRCPHCWADFDEDVEGYNNEPKRAPCCGKWFGVDCFVEFLEGTGPLCPLCRQDMLAASTVHAE